MQEDSILIRYPVSAEQSSLNNSIDLDSWNVRISEDSSDLMQCVNRFEKMNLEYCLHFVAIWPILSML